MQKYLDFNNIILVLFVIGIPNFFVVYEANNLYSETNIDLNVIIRLGISVIGLGWLIINVARDSIFQKHILKPFIFPFLFYVFYLVTVVFMQQELPMYKSIYRIFEYFLFLSLLIVYFRASSLPPIDKLIEFFEVLFVYIVLIVIFSLVFYTELIVGFIDSGEGYIRLGGSVIHPNTLGNLSAMAIFYYMFASKSANSYRYVMSALFLLFLFLSFSRGAILSFLVVMFFIYYLHSRGGFKYIIFFLIFLFIAIFTILFGDHIVELFSRGQGIEGMFSFSGRAIVWLSAIDIILLNMQNFLIGISFGEASSIIGDVMSLNYDIYHWKSQNAHNDFLQAWLGGGIIYFCLTVLLHIKLIIIILKCQDFNVRKFLISFYVIVLFFSISMTTINYYLHPFSALFWLVYIAILLNKSTLNLRGFK